ncbi:MAG: hypothetical protein ACRC0B_03265 [Legionella sp.]
MSNEEQHAAELFINHIDSSTRENIIKLDQKLNGLKAEVEAKLNSLTRYYPEQNAALIEHWQVVAKEINQSLTGIDALVRLVASEAELGQVFLQGPLMQQHSKQIALDLEAISRLKDEL